MAWLRDLFPFSVFFNVNLVSYGVYSYVLIFICSIYALEHSNFSFLCVLNFWKDPEEVLP